MICPNAADALVRAVTLVRVAKGCLENDFEIPKGADYARELAEVLASWTALGEALEAAQGALSERAPRG